MARNVRRGAIQEVGRKKGKRVKIDEQERFPENLGNRQISTSRGHHGK
jgi:hypothetical protein